jgi:hypothetical protein
MVINYYRIRVLIAMIVGKYQIDYGGQPTQACAY